jgi:trans-2,3-dihydro-3-hydroxyanthranilate isomerase
MRFSFYTADVFTDRIFGGNPLAVFPNADGLNSLQMQAVTRELNLSETVFVLPPAHPGHTRRLRIFTPGMEIGFAGHPTIGTAYVLAAIGEITLAGDETNIVFEEGVGPVPVKIQARDDKPIFTQLSAAMMPEPLAPPPAMDDLAALLSLDANDFVGKQMPPQGWTAGIPFLFVPLLNREALRRVRIRLDIWERLLKDYAAPQIYTFTHDTDSAAIRARMFAPAFNIPEDPATGSAATALAGYLNQFAGVSNGMMGWVIEQGFEMGRPSFLNVEADLKDGAITGVRVGGASVMVSAGEMEIPGA